MVVSQNSGIGNMMGALTSLMYTFRLPVLLIISWRGKPGHADEPQHELMGQITCRSLDLLGVRHIPFPGKLDELRVGVETSAQYMKSHSLPFAFVLSPGIMSFKGADRRVAPCQQHAGNNAAISRRARSHEAYPRDRDHIGPCGRR